MSDQIEKIGHSLIQHGDSNSRVYLMKYKPEDHPALLDQIEKLADENGYTKIFAKVPTFAKDDLAARGYRQEAHAPLFFRGEDDAYFFGKYLSEERSTEKEPTTVADVIAAAKGKAGKLAEVKLDEGFSMREATDEDVEGMVEVYKQIFETYPFPIHDPNYIRQTMTENIVYFVIREGDRVVAVASSEMDEGNLNVEMTDFASLDEYQGRGFATLLLSEMEKAMKARGIKTAYTIARALSFGMNITFAKHGYEFGGTLVNNTNIAGKIESMNVWYKSL